MQATPVRRIITGHDIHGRAVIVADGATPHVRSSPYRPGVFYHNLWTTTQTPAPIDGVEDPVTDAMPLPPPPMGSSFRFVEFGPEKDYPQDPATVQRGFAELGNASEALVDQADSRHSAMHKTMSIDYGIVIEGEIWLIMDEGEVLMKQGDVCIQRGTNHAWTNRSDARCVMAFVLIAAEEGPASSPR